MQTTEGYVLSDEAHAKLENAILDTEAVRKMIGRLYLDPLDNRCGLRPEDEDMLAYLQTRLDEHMAEIRRQTGLA